MPELQPFPSDWRTARWCWCPHPDDPEYGVAAAVAKWTAAGKTVHYALASRGEVGIAGMPPEKAGPLREGRTAAVGGHRRRGPRASSGTSPTVHIRNTPNCAPGSPRPSPSWRPTSSSRIYSGPEWAPGAPNQRDHIEFSNAVAGAY